MLIVYILDGFPSDSEYFILNEISELIGKGLDIRIVAIRKGRGWQSAAARYTGNAVLYDRHFFSPVKLIAHLYLLFSAPGKYLEVISDVAAQWRFSPVSLAKGLTRFSIGVYFLFLLRKIPVDHLHAHFSSVPADIAMIMSGLSGKGFSCSAHARDIYTADQKSLIRKIDRAQFFITCTASNKRFLERLSCGTSRKVFHVYHGIDLASWPAKSPNRPGGEPSGVRLLTVSRLVAKKGIIYLLEAVKMLRDLGIGVNCVIIGDGPLHQLFERYRDVNGLHANIHLHGALPQSEVKSFYRSADIFVLPSVIAADGDRDGLPNVLMEALAVGIPVVTTSISAIPELVIHGLTGMLVPDRSPDGIRDAILRLLQDKELYERISRNGRRKVEEEFNIQASTDQLVEIFTSNGQCV
jgi:colanic acid/amylovoran biosynthesis glycosyltransferase